MAGSYPDAPNNRIPLDLHGAIVVNLGNSVQYAASVIQSLSGESGAWAIWSQPDDTHIVVVFPYNIDATHWYIGGNTDEGRIYTTAYSTDTTNGIDGTWTSVSIPCRPGGSVDIRQNIQSFPINNCKAVRVYLNAGNLDYAWISAFHVYGAPSAGENPDRLELWHPTLDQRVSGAHFDWGDVPRGSSSDKQFRIKNRSDTLTANNTVVSVSALTEASPLFAPTHTLSTNGTTFTATVAVPTISPGAISPIITLRKTTPADAQVSVWTARVTATATTWT